MSSNHNHKNIYATMRFLGGAGTVTGSKYHFTLPSEMGGQEFLLECGLFQGLKELRLRNWQTPPFSINNLSTIVISHAHIDHSGYLPLVVKNGYRGPIYCTSATADLLEELLPDSAHLQEEAAEHANIHGYSKHHPALPLYTGADAMQTLKQIVVQPFHEPFEVIKGGAVQAEYRRAGHILGAATVLLNFKHRQPEKKTFRLAFSGDLGRYDRPILPDPEPIEHADMLLMESTYGDRLHPKNADQELARIVNAAVQRGGALIIPAFAVGRTQELIWRLRMLEEKKQIPSLPIFIDSPMATNVTRIYTEHPEDQDLELAKLRDHGGTPLRSSKLKFIRSVEESKSLNHRHEPIIIISASGMATGGRVLHHLEHRLADKRTTILLVGFQAAGTRGRSLQDGAKELRMHGKNIPVKATIEMHDGLSAHADQGEILRWLKNFRSPPKQTYLVHGESAAAQQLAETIRKTMHWQVEVAVDRQQIQLL